MCTPTRMCIYRYLWGLYTVKQTSITFNIQRKIHVLKSKSTLGVRNVPYLATIEYFLKYALCKPSLQTMGLGDIYINHHGSCIIYQIVYLCYGNDPKLKKRSIVWNTSNVKRINCVSEWCYPRPPKRSAATYFDISVQNPACINIK